MAPVRGAKGRTVPDRSVRRPCPQVSDLKSDTSG